MEQPEVESGSKESAGEEIPKLFRYLKYQRRILLFLHQTYLQFT